MRASANRTPNDGNSALFRVGPADRRFPHGWLGLLGNTGSNSDLPHLHFQICDGPLSYDSDGLPFVFDSFSPGLIYDGVGDRDGIQGKHGTEAQFPERVPAVAASSEHCRKFPQVELSVLCGLA
jgi:hypothetical protein